MKNFLLPFILTLGISLAIAEESKISHDIAPVGALWLKVIGSKDDGPYYATDTKSGVTYRVRSAKLNQKQGDYLYGFFFKINESKKKAGDFSLLMQLEIIDLYFSQSYTPDISERRLRFWTGYKSLMEEYKKLTGREVVDKVEDLTANGGNIYWEKILEPHLILHKN